MQRSISILALGLLLAGVAVLSSDVLFRGRVLSGPDMVNYFIPTAHFAVGTLRHGDLPLWNPLTFCGWPQVGDPQLRWFYPPNLLLLLLDPARVFSILMVAYTAFAALGMWFYLRRAAAVGPWPALCGAAAFSLSGFFACHMMSGILVFPATASWVPWILLLGWKLGDPTRALRKTALLGIALGAQILAGAPQIVFYTWIALILQCLWLIISEITRSRRAAATNESGGRGSLRIVGLYLAAGILGVALAASSLLPSSEFGALSFQRGGKARWEYVTDCSLAPRYLWLMVAPRFFCNPHNERVYWGGQEGYWDVCGYMGLGPLAALFVVLLAWRALFRREGIAAADDHPSVSDCGCQVSTSRFALFHLVLAALGLFLAFGRYNRAFRFLYEFVPGFDRFRVPARFLLFWEFGLATLFALFLNRYLTGKSNAGPPLRLRALAGVFAFVAFLAIGAVFSPTLMEASGVRNYNPVFDPTSGRMPDTLWISSTRGSLLRAALFGLGWLILLGIAAKTSSISLRRILLPVAAFLVLADVLHFGLSMVVTRTPKDQNAEFYAKSPLISFLTENLDGHRYLALDDVHDYRRDQNQPELWADRAMVAAIHDARGYYPLCLRWFGQFINAVNGRQPDYPMGGLLAIGDTGRLDLRLLALLDVRLLLSYQNLAVNGLRLAHETSFGLRLYEVLDRCGAAFLARAVFQGNPTEGEELALLTSPGFDSSTSALVCKGPPARWPQPTTGPLGEIVRFERPTPNRIVLEIKRGIGDLLIVSEAFHPGWTATVDGVRQPVIRADHALIGVYVPPDSRHVELTFRPASFRLGLYVTLLAVLALCATAVRSKPR